MEWSVKVELSAICVNDSVYVSAGVACDSFLCDDLRFDRVAWSESRQQEDECDADPNHCDKESDASCYV